MVYCRAGQSRSATLCIAYFMKYHGLSYEEAFQFVRARRPIIHPNIGFIRQLKEFEEKCKLKESVTSLAIGCTTPALHRKAEPNPVSFPIPLSTTESFATDESILFENNELEAILLGSPCLDLAYVTVHDHFKEVAETCAVDVVNICDKFSTAVLSPPDVPNIGIHEPQSVAETGLEPTGDNTGVWDPAERRNKRRTAFTRLSKPNEIAVSFINLILDLQHISNKITPFKINTNKEYCTSEYAELQQAYEIYEEVPDVCLGQVADLGCAGRPSGPVIIHSIICKPHMCPTCSFVVPLFDIDITVPKLSKNLGKQSLWTVSKNSSFRGRKILPDKSHNLNNPGFRRLNSNTVKSVDTPAQNKAIKASIKICDELLSNASVAISNCCWEDYETFKNVQQGNQFEKENKVKAVFQAHSSVIISKPCVLDSLKVSDTSDLSKAVYHKLDFSIAEFDSCLIASSLLVWLLGNGQLQFGNEMRVIKQYPYYSKVIITSAIEMLRATEGAKLKTQWFQIPDQKKTTNQVRLVRKVSDCKDKFQEKDVVLRWGTENWIKNDLTFSYEMADHIWKEEYVNIEPSDRLSTHYFETEIYQICKNDLIGRFYVPQYNSVLLKKESGAVFYELVQIQQPPVYELNNMYSVPRTILLEARAKQYIHGDYLIAPTTNLAYAIADEESLESIPDEIHDLSYLKEFLSSSSSAKCNIWLDVFKRTLMKLKPAHANLTYTEPLLNSERVSLTLLESNSEIIMNKPSMTEVANIILNPIPPKKAINCLKVTVIETYVEFTSLENKKVIPEDFERQMSVTDSCVIEYFSVVWDIVQDFQGSFCMALQEHATSTVSFPNKLYSVSHIDVKGLTAHYSRSKEHQRTAFQIVTKLLCIASHQHSPHLTFTGHLPSYQFVQDVEDWPDHAVQSIEANASAELNEVHVLWFFALDSNAHSNENPSNYLLFLPDPETATLIGQEDFEGSNEGAIINPDLIVNEVLHEINDINDKQAKHVSFSEDSPLLKPKQKVKTIYYGRDRSKSKQRLKDLHSSSRKRSPSRHNEQEIMENLSKSVREANGILARRREPGRYEQPGTPMPRGRETSRRTQSSVESYDVNSRIMSPTPYRRVTSTESHDVNRRVKSEAYVSNRVKSESYDPSRRLKSPESYDPSRRLKSPDPYTSSQYDRDEPAGDSMLSGIMSMAQSVFSRGPVRRETGPDHTSRYSRQSRKYT